MVVKTCANYDIMLIQMGAKYPMGVCGTAAIRKFFAGFVRRVFTMAITKDMSILEVVQKYPDTAEVFMSAGMGCLGCAAAHFENIEQGALAHGIDVDALIQGLNDCVGAAE